MTPNGDVKQLLAPADTGSARPGVGSDKELPDDAGQAERRLDAGYQPVAKRPLLMH